MRITMANNTTKNKDYRTELSQSVARIVLTILVITIIAIAALTNDDFPKKSNYMSVLLFYMIYSVLIYAHIRIYPQPIVMRRVINIISDLSMTSYGMYVMGKYGGIVYPGYMWMIVGNGMRFGIRYLVFAAIVGAIGFLIAVYTSQYWIDHKPLAFGLFYGMIIVSMFYAIVLRELEKTNRDLEIQKEAAEQANRAKSRFLAAASHDLRQPLQAQTLFIEQLYGKLKDPESSYTLVKKLEDSVSAMRSLFNALLDISKLDAGVIQPHKTHFNLQSFMSVLKEEYSTQAKAKGLNFSMHCTDTVVHTDRGLLDSIMHNILTNAVNYTKYGEISVKCIQSEDIVTIEVSDTGIGIKPEHLEDIFQEFYQIDNPERNRDQGLGLGLSVVQRISMLLNCPVNVYSVYGEGSTFSIDIPFGDGALVTAQPESNLESRHILDGNRVIVIDDEQAIRDAMLGLLETWGCEVLIAGSGDDILFKISDSGFNPDIIIADYRLPGSMNGVQVVGEIRALFNHDVPAILITGDIAIDKLQDVQESQIPFLHKPIHPGKLRTLMQHLLKSISP